MNRGGVYHRIAAFFAANPHEELTRSDMLLKFGSTAGAIENALDRLRRARFIEREVVFRAVQPEPTPATPACTPNAAPGLHMAGAAPSVAQGDQTPALVWPPLPG